MPVITILYCEECGFKKYATLLNGYFSESFKDKPSISVETRSSNVKGTFDVWLLSNEETEFEKEKQKRTVIHCKHEKTNGFGLFANKEHVVLLKSKIDEALQGL